MHAWVGARGIYYHCLVVECQQMAELHPYASMTSVLHPAIHALWSCHQASSNWQWEHWLSVTSTGSGLNVMLVANCVIWCRGS